VGCRGVLVATGRAVLELLNLESERMAESTMESAATPPRFERTMEIDSQFARRVTAGSLRYVLLTPNRLIRIAVLSLVISLAVTVTARPEGFAVAGVFVLGFLVMPVVYFLVFALAFPRARKQVDDRLPVGSHYSMALGEDTMVLKDGFATTEVSYRLFKSVWASKSLVVLHPRHGRRTTILPRELFGADSLAWLTSRLGTD